MVTDCPKFIPNIFSKEKCSSCFKTREDHGDTSLDSESSRRVIKCGYLFIAPRDWDFCNPSAHRTKRWQRRFFVLYSDDQLTWSIDEHPETIPQGSLDMREILEVKNAEDITENQHSLALTGKSTTFIKGVSKEDISSWTQVLTKYGNKLLTTAGGKRSLTLPGGFGGGSPARFETGVVVGPSRQRFHSVATPPVVSGLTSPGNSYGKCFVDSPPSPPRSNKMVKTSPSSPDSSPLIMSISTSSTSSSPMSTSGGDVLHRSSNNPSSSSPSRHQLQQQHHHRLILQQQNQQQQQHRSNHPYQQDNHQVSSEHRHHVPPETSSSPQSSTSSSYNKCFDSSSDVTDSHSMNSIQYSPCSTNSVRALRGDPDGCGGLDASDRKGWLLKQLNNEWLKHWFVLKNNQLIFYENSEEFNPLGTIEITDDTSIKQFDSSRHYGFEIRNNSSIHKLSAITNGMRGIWMKALESSKIKVKEQQESVEIIQPPSPTQIVNPPSPPMKSKKSRWRKKSDLKLFESVKDEFAERERELEFLRTGTELSRGDSPRMREILKSQAVQIDNFRTQLSSGFMEIEKLEMFCRSREAEYAESLKCKDEIIEEVRDQLTKEINVREKIELQSHELDRQVQLLAEKVAKVQDLLGETERELDLTNLNHRELSRISESQRIQLRQELNLLRSRCNDLTEKLYQSEKTAKTLKTKLGRVKSQSLKDRQIDSDVISKLNDLEEKISRFDNLPLSPTSTVTGAYLSLPPSTSSPNSPTECGGLNTSSAATTPTTGGRDGGIIGVIMKLNDLDQRVEKVTESLWFRRGELEDMVGGECENCKLLEMEVRERDERLEVLDGNLKKLEFEFDKKMQVLREFVKEQPPQSQEPSPTHAQSCTKYQVEIEQLRNLCAKGLEAMENSHRRMILEVEEKHRREMQNLRIEKEQELADETKATLSALDAMRKNHQLELQREMAKFKEEFMRKFQCNQDLTDLHKEHEEELHEVKTEILRLTEKYSLKCVEASKLEETVTYLKAQLNEAKRRVIELETNEFQTSISSASKKPDQVTALRSRLEQLILCRPVDETSAKAEDQSSAAASASGASSPLSPTVGTGSGGGFSSSLSASSKRSRHSIIRSPSCPKPNSRLTVLE